MFSKRMNLTGYLRERHMAKIEWVEKIRQQA